MKNKLLLSLLITAFIAGTLAGCQNKPEETGNIPKMTPFPGNYDEIKTDYEERTDYSVSPTSNQLIFSGEWQERWLSLPDSRIVVNPTYDYSWDTELPQSNFLNSNKVPLNIGHLSPYVSTMSDREIFMELLMIFDDTDGGIKPASSYTTSWAPHALPFSAEFESGFRISGKDYFYDEKTVIRDFTYEGNSAPVICGKIDYSCVKKDSCILIKGRSFIITISFNTDFDLIFYESQSFAERGLPGNESQVTEAGTFWKAEFKEPPADNRIIAAVSVETKDAAEDEVIKRSSDAANYSEPDNKFKERVYFWNEFLKRIPVPGTFNFETVEELGATQSERDRMYYTAWVLLGQNTLPKAPETGFNYRQMCCGKPSMWAEGEARAVYSAAWESLYGIQMYAYINPDIAWECLEGFMSLVERSDDPNRNGMIAGESLPCNRSRTAWILYQMTNDKSKLDAVFENLDLNLYWSLNHPYWIYKENNPLDLDAKDIDFTGALLVDMPYMIKICNELGKTEELQKWQGIFNQFLTDFPKWHLMKVKYRGEEVLMASGDVPLWTGKAIYSKDLKEEGMMGFYRLLNNRFREDKTFAGFDKIKLEEIMYCIYGLYDHGFDEMAKILNECSIREVTRASGLGENYTSDRNQPRTTGVRSSLFGTVEIIDSIWIRNGYRYDSGTPTIQNFFSSGGLQNVHFGDKEFSYTLENGKAIVNGSYVEGEKVIDIENKSSVIIK